MSSKDEKETASGDLPPTTDGGEPLPGYRGDRFVLGGEPGSGPKTEGIRPEDVKPDFGPIAWTADGRSIYARASEPLACVAERRLDPADRIRKGDFVKVNTSDGRTAHQPVHAGSIGKLVHTLEIYRAPEEWETGICAVCLRPIERNPEGAGLWYHVNDVRMRPTHDATPKAQVVETGWVGAPPAEGLPGATGIPGPPDGKMSAAELLEVREIDTAAGGGVCPKCAFVFVDGECPNCHFSGIMQAFRGPEAEPAAEKPPCECWRMAGFRNCPRHRHLCEPPDSPAFQTGVGAATEPPFSKEPSFMPSWLPEVLGQARAADLADAGHRLAKCGVCGRLLYEKSGVFIHDGSGVEHGGVPTEIFDPSPANTAGVCFTCPPVGFFEALLNRLFPQEFPELPEVEWAPPNAAPKGDVIHLTGVTHFSVLDRLRLIVSGRLMTRAMIVCENEAGRTKSVMTVRPLAPGRGRE